MPEPANLREPYNMNMAELRRGVDAMHSRPATAVDGVEHVDAQTARIADMVAAATSAAVEAHLVKGSTPATVRAAALKAITPSASG